MSSWKEQLERTRNWKVFSLKVPNEIEKTEVGMLVVVKWFLKLEIFKVGWKKCEVGKVLLKLETSKEVGKSVEIEKILQRNFPT